MSDHVIGSIEIHHESTHETLTVSHEEPAHLGYQGKAAVTTPTKKKKHAHHSSTTCSIGLPLMDGWEGMYHVNCNCSWKALLASSEYLCSPKPRALEGTFPSDTA